MLTKIARRTRAFSYSASVCIFSWGRYLGKKGKNGRKHKDLINEVCNCLLIKYGLLIITHCITCIRLLVEQTLMGKISERIKTTLINGRRKLTWLSFSLFFLPCQPLEFPERISKDLLRLPQILHACQSIWPIVRDRERERVSERKRERERLRWQIYLNGKSWERERRKKE